MNTARVRIADEMTLVEVLKKRKIKSSAIDVHEESKMNRNLIGMENVVLTLYIGKCFTFIVKYNIDKLTLRRL
ncbi:NAD(P)-dependent oxidoreductase [Staphylococcus sp. IPLA37010]|uniref:NAD(P)-dependent oxidoreductase n=1 Tax=Staphylococcus sp. IPLA37010 TaxID=3417200 RepID=UPI003CE80618